MDAISYSYADKQAKRIKKFINDPDSTSGVLTVPKVIASGESVTIPAGRIAILPNVQVDGTLNVQGDVFIPSGATMSKVVEKVTSTDNALVRFNGTTGDVQNSGVIIDDNNNLKANSFAAVGETKTHYISTDSNVGGTNAFRITRYSNSGTYEATPFQIDVNGNLGIGTNSSYGKLQVKTSESGLEVNPNYTNIFGTTLTTRLLAYDRTNSVRRPIELDGSVISLVNAGGNISLANTGNILVNTITDNGVDKLQINGNISYKTPSGRIVGTILANAYISDTNSHTLTSSGANSPLMLEIVNINSGVTCIPIYPYGGTGMKFIWNVLNPTTGAFVNNVSTQNINLTVTDRGLYPNTYIITLNGNNSNITIQATTLNAYFTAYLTVM